MTSRANKTIWCDAWYVPVMYGFCPSDAAWKRLMREYRIDHTQHPYPHSNIGCCTTLLNKSGDTCLIVTISAEQARGYSRRYIASILVHEATHVWQNMCEKMHDEAASREAQAYSLQTITRNLFAAYEKTRGPLFR